MPALLPLDAESCRTLLCAGIVGRLGFVVDGTPRIVPLNYAMDGRDVVVAVARGSELGRLVAAGAPVGVFEVDHVDHERHQGWSVTVTGPVLEVRGAAELRRISRGWSPRPWADGDRSMLLRVLPERVSGRRLGVDWGRPDDLDVRRRV